MHMITVPVMKTALYNQSLFVQQFRITGHVSPPLFRPIPGSTTIHVSGNLVCEAIKFLQGDQH